MTPDISDATRALQINVIVVVNSPGVMSAPTINVSLGSTAPPAESSALSSKAEGWLRTGWRWILRRLP